MRGSAITGIGINVPDVVVRNADLEKVFDTTDKWITERTGISERRVPRGVETLRIGAMRRMNS